MQEGQVTLDMPPAVHVHPDHSVDVVLERFRQSEGRLPVLSRANVRLQLGTITLASLMSYVQPRELPSDEPSGDG
jgi:hypothetical protein